MFITFEGIDCSGKSTQARLLAQRLREHDREVLELREPGNTRLSEHIRSILLNKEYSEINERTELLLFAASRAQLVGEIILPALHHNKIVICDRFSDSSIAYQGYGRGLPLEDIVHINRVATQETEPDMTFYLDISPETAVTRSCYRNGVAQDRMEEGASASLSASFTATCTWRTQTREDTTLSTEASRWRRYNQPFGGS